MLKLYEQGGNQRVWCHIDNGILLFIHSEEPLTEFYIPREVRSHMKWAAYDPYDTLQAIYAHPESETYASHDGALYDKAKRTLLYIPRGKTTLHLPKEVRFIGIRALEHRNIQSVTVDEENPYFCVVDGMLYDREMKSLYFVPPSQTTLHIAPGVVGMDSSVLARGYAAIEVADGNPRYWTSEHLLVHGHRVVYCRTVDGKLHIPAGAHPHFLQKPENKWRLWDLRELTADADHPDCCAVDGILYSADRSELLYIPAQAEKAVLPSALEALEAACFEERTALRLVSVHVGTRFSPRCLKGLHSECRVEVRLNDTESVLLPRLESEGLAACIRFLQCGEAQVKPGTELFYLDLYLLNHNASEAFAHVMHLNAWQIIKCVIAQNDLTRMQALLRDGRLMTEKNLSRARKLACESGRAELQALLHVSKEEII